MSQIGMAGAALLTGLFMSVAGAAAQTGAPFMPGDDIDSVRFPACFDDKGEPVRYFNDGKVDIRPWVAYAGARYLETVPFIAKPAIFYDPEFIAGLSPLERDFTFAHECYHLSSGDAREYYMYEQMGADMPEEEIGRIERDADCGAARRMRTEYGYSEEDMAGLAGVIRKTTGGIDEERARMAHIMSCFASMFSA